MEVPLDAGRIVAPGVPHLSIDTSDHPLKGTSRPFPPDVQPAADYRGAVPVTLHRSEVRSMDPLTLYAILRLRVDVFVVEQRAAYPDLDGRDAEPGAELLWAADGDEVLATLRILREPDGALRVGRVATAPAARSRGVASMLMRVALERCAALDPTAPVVLDAQAHLAGWYARFGFEVAGAGFDEDGIPHVPMRRTA